jgi:hypothetical protein
MTVKKSIAEQRATQLAEQRRLKNEHWQKRIEIQQAQLEIARTKRDKLAEFQEELNRIKLEAARQKAEAEVEAYKQALQIKAEAMKRRAELALEKQKADLKKVEERLKAEEAKRIAAEEKRLAAEERRLAEQAKRETAELKKKHQLELIERRKQLLKEREEKKRLKKLREAKTRGLMKCAMKAFGVNIEMAEKAKILDKAFELASKVRSAVAKYPHMKRRAENNAVEDYLKPFDVLQDVDKASSLITPEEIPQEIEGTDLGWMLREEAEWNPTILSPLRDLGVRELKISANQPSETSSDTVQQQAGLTSGPPCHDQPTLGVSGPKDGIVPQDASQGLQTPSFSESGVSGQGDVSTNSDPIRKGGGRGGNPSTFVDVMAAGADVMAAGADGPIETRDPICKGGGRGGNPSTFVDVMAAGADVPAAGAHSSVPTSDTDDEIEWEPAFLGTAPEADQSGPGVLGPTAENVAGKGSQEVSGPASGPASGIIFGNPPPPPKRKPKEIIPIASGYETPLTEIP